MMRFCALAAAVLAIASASVVRQEKQGVPVLGNGNEVPDPERVCTKSGEKCAGAPGRPLVVYSECCDTDLVCAFPADADDDLWGQFCIAADDATVIPTITRATDATTSEDDDDAATRTIVATRVVTVTATTDAQGNTVAPVVVDPTATDEEDAVDDEDDDGDDDDGSVCFPASATVELEDGSIVRMDALSIGDVVKVGVNEFSPVFMFTHKMSSVVNNFVTLQTGTGASLTLTKGHYIHANGALTAAGELSVGDEVVLGSGITDKIVSVGQEKNVGLFNPQTVNGDVIVNGVLASTYTTAVEPTFAHAILSPMRFLNALGLHMTSLESGGGILADVAPRGQASV